MERKYSNEVVDHEIRRAEENSNLTYEEFMRDFLGVVVYVNRSLKHKTGFINRIKKIQRRALCVSLRRIKKEELSGEPLTKGFLRKNYSNYCAVSKDLFSRRNGKSPLDILIKESGVFSISSRTDKRLKQLLSELSSIGDFPEDFTQRAFNQFPGIGNAIRKRFGYRGKGVVLAGVDYLSKKRILTSKRKIVFSKKDLERISCDESLTLDEKTACFFNICLFQYFKTKGITSLVEKVYDEDIAREYAILEERELKIPKIRLNFSVKSRGLIGLTYRLARLELSIEPEIKNKAHNLRIYFHGENARFDCRQYYEYFDEMLFNFEHLYGIICYNV